MSFLPVGAGGAGLLLLLSSFLLSSLELSDTKDYEPLIRALIGTASYFCEVVVLESRRGLNEGRLVMFVSISGGYHALLPLNPKPRISDTNLGPSERVLS